MLGFRLPHAKYKRLYRKYIRHNDWKVKRNRRMKKDDGLCQMCLLGGREREATEVHHRTYKRIFHERMADLVSLCRSCHEHYHKTER